MSDDTMDVVWETEFSKMDDDRQQVFGWASITSIDGQPVIDRQRDYIAPDDLEEAAYSYVLKSRDGGDMHKRTGVATLIESFLVTPEKVAKMGLPEGSLPTGWWVGYQVHDDQTWGEVKKGRYTGFSIHGLGKRRDIELEDIYEGDETFRKNDDTLLPEPQVSEGHYMDRYEIAKAFYEMAEDAAEARSLGEINHEFDIAVDPELYEWVEENSFAKGDDDEGSIDYQYERRGGDFILVEEALEDIAKAYELGDVELLEHLSVLFDADLIDGDDFEDDEFSKSDDDDQKKGRRRALLGAGAAAAAGGAYGTNKGADIRGKVKTNLGTRLESAGTRRATELAAGGNVGRRFGTAINAGAAGKMMAQSGQKTGYASALRRQAGVSPARAGAMRLRNRH